MYYVKKTIEVSMAHALKLDYESKCTQVHGHNALVTVCCKSRTLNKNGMVIDFSEIKRTVKDLLDHQMVNEKVNFNPTAENLARWICEHVENCYKVVFQESEKNVAVYEKDDD